jgi:tetratricopeptide (TPR) repeat protein
MWKPMLAACLLLALMGCGRSDTPEQNLKDAIIHYNQKDYTGAIKYFEKAIAQEAKSAETYNKLGMAYRFRYLQTKDHKLQANAMDAFEKALKLDPKCWEAMINLGFTYHDRGEKARAAFWFKKALAINPNPPEKAKIQKLMAEGSAAHPATHKTGRKHQRRR